MPKGVFSIIDDLSSQLNELKRALAPLAGLVSSSRTPSVRRSPGRPRPTGGSVSPRPAASKRMPTKRKRVTSPKVRAMRKQQGQYLGALRQLTPAQRQQVKKAKATGDYASALKVAAGFAKKSVATRKTSKRRKMKVAVLQPTQG